MPYCIACIGSRVNTDEALDRAIRLIKTVTHPLNSSDNAVFLYHTGNPFELKVAEAVSSTLGRRNVQTTVMVMDFGHFHDMSWWVRNTHPRPNKLSKKSFGDLCHVAYVLSQSRVVMASPYKQGRGRAALALQIAARNYMPSIDLSSDEAEHRIAKMEAKVDKYEQHEAAALAYADLLEQRKIENQQAVDDAFVDKVREYLHENHERVANDESASNMILEHALILFQDGVIKSPAIRNLDTYSADGNIIISSVSFEDEFIIQEAPRRRRRRGRRRKARRAARVVDYQDEAVEANGPVRRVIRTGIVEPLGESWGADEPLDRGNPHEPPEEPLRVVAAGNRPVRRLEERAADEIEEEMIRAEIRDLAELAAEYRAPLIPEGIQED